MTGRESEPRLTQGISPSYPGLTPVSAVGGHRMGPSGGPIPASEAGTTAADARAGPPDAVSDVPRPRRMVGFEISLETASLDELDRMHRVVDDGWVGSMFEGSSATEEATRLATCHRVELLTVVRSDEEADRWKRALPGPVDAWRARSGRHLIRHLFRVAAGQGSLAVGEREVRDQVRAAGHTTRSRDPRPVLPELFAKAADAADELFPSIPLERSVAGIAAARALALVGRSEPTVLVIGAGTVGRQLAAALSRGARVTLAYRYHPPEEELLRTLGVRSVPVESVPSELPRSDIVITAAKSGNRCLGPEDLPAHHPLLLVDLGVPRNIDPAVRSVPSVRLLDLEDLRASSRTGPPPPEDPRLTELADRFAGRWDAVSLEPWIDELRRWAENLRRAEVDRARAFLGALTPEQEAALERVTRRIVAGLLRTSTERLRALPPGEEADRLRRFALELFRPGPHDR